MGEEVQDDALMVLVARGDHSAFETLFERHTGRCLGYAKRLLGGDQQLAEDMVQACWIKVVQMAPHYQAQGQFVAWIYTMIRNACRDEQRRRSRFQDFPSGAESNERDDQFLSSKLQSMSVERSILDELIERTDVLRLHACIDGLPELQRAVLMAWITEDLSYEDLAQQFRTTIPSIKSLLFRARETLEKKIGGSA